MNCVKRSRMGAGQTPNSFVQGASITRTVGLSPFGSAYASIRPTEDPADPANTNGLSGNINLTINADRGGAPRFRVFLVDIGADATTTADDTIAPFDGCATQPGEACVPDAQGFLNLTIPVNTRIREVLLVASATSSSSVFDYTFSTQTPGTEIKIIQPTSMAAAPIGSATSRRPFLLEFEVRDTLNRPYVAVAPEHVQITIDGNVCDGCIASSISQNRGQYAYLISVPEALYPASGTAVYDLGLLWNNIPGSSPQALVVTDGTSGITTVATAIAMDLSGSMLEGNKLGVLSEAAKMVVNSHRLNTDYVGLFGFQYDSWRISATNPFTDALRTQLETEIDNAVTQAGNATSIGDALFRASDSVISRVRVQNAGNDTDLPASWSANVVVITDGMGNCDSTVNDFLFSDQDDDVQSGESMEISPGEFLVCETQFAIDNGFTPVPVDSEVFTTDVVGLSDRMDAASFVPRISTIALGQEVDWAQLGWISSLTGGSFIGVPLDALPITLQQVAGPLDGLTDIADALTQMRNAGSNFGRIAADYSRFAFDIEAGTREMLVTVATNGGDPSRRLINPQTGTPLSPVAESFGTSVFRLDNPDAGTWTWESSSETAETFVDVSTRHPLELIVMAGPHAGLTAPEGQNPGTILIGQFTGLPLRINALAHEDGVAVTSATAFADVTKPDGTVVSVQLFDDGEHDDGRANDGRFANAFYQTAQPGPYTIVTTAEGTSPSTGDFFRRIKLTTTQLGSPADDDADDLPDYWEQTYGVDDPSADDDADDLTNVEEYELGTNPVESDTDGGGESDGSEVAAGRNPLSAADDTMPAPAPAVAPGNERVLIKSGYSGEAYTVVIQTVAGGVGTTVLSEPATYDDNWIVPSVNGVETCFRVRLEASSAVSAWSQVICVTTSSDALPPELEAQVGRCQYGVTVPVTLHARDPSSFGDDAASIPDLGIEVSGVTEYRLAYGTGAAGETLVFSDWMPFMDEIQIPIGNFEGAVVSAQVRDAAGNESELSAISFEDCTCDASPPPVGCCDDIGNCAGVSDIALYAEGELAIRDGVAVIGTTGTQATVANAGGDLTQVGVNGSVGDIYSVSNVDLRNDLDAIGVVRSSGSVALGNNEGVTYFEGEALDLPSIQGFAVGFPGPAEPLDNPGCAIALDPGSYQDLVVAPGCTLDLAAGTYYFNKFDLEPQTTLFLDTATGPVYVYIADTFIFRGSIVASGGTPDRFFVGYFGSTLAALERPYAGTVVAPNARMKLESMGPHQGSFFAKELEVTPHVDVEHVPFPYPWVAEGSACDDCEPPPDEPSCDDGEMNGLETGEDCGGPTCLACDNGEGCLLDSDCTSGNCQSGVCAPSTFVYSFEGSHEGWTYFESPGTSVQTSATQAFDGSRSLQLNVSGSGNPRVWVVPQQPPAPGSTVTYRVYVPSWAPLTAIQPYVSDQNWSWTWSWKNVASWERGSWITVSVNVPPGFNGPAKEVGLKFYFSNWYWGPVFVDGVELTP